MIEKILSYIYQKSPTQKKKIEKMILDKPLMQKELEYFLNTYSVFMSKYSIKYEEICDSYLLMNNQMLHARIYFLKEGKYPTESSIKALDDVYSNPILMRKYMLGLALSQFLWEHHYDVYSFFKKNIPALEKDSIVLEVGSGHGLFLSEMLKKLKSIKFDVVDISNVSLDISSELAKVLFPLEAKSIRYHCSDILDFQTELSYDFIAMGEVLEHVENPLLLLKKLYTLLNENGKLFISTCSNCPAIDHIYLFNSTEEIIAMILDAGFEIEEQIESCSENITDEKKMKKYKPDIMFAAILTKRG